MKAGTSTQTTDPAGCDGAVAGASGRSSERLASGARLLKAIADETRLSILHQLRQQEEICACEFVACCDVAQPTVSHHLKVLREAGLVEGERRASWVYYRLAPGALARLHAALP